MQNQVLFFLKSNETSESILASWDSRIPADDTSLSNISEPIELFEKSEDFCDYFNFLI